MLAWCLLTDCWQSQGFEVLWASRLWVWPHVPFCFCAAVPQLSVLLGWHFTVAPTTAVGHWTSVSHRSHSLSCLCTRHTVSVQLPCICMCTWAQRVGLCAAYFDAGHTWYKLWSTVLLCLCACTAHHCNRDFLKALHACKSKLFRKVECQRWWKRNLSSRDVGYPQIFSACTYVCLLSCTTMLPSLALTFSAIKPGQAHPYRKWLDCCHSYQSIMWLNSSFSFCCVVRGEKQWKPL